MQRPPSLARIVRPPWERRLQVTSSFETARSSARSSKRQRRRRGHDGGDGFLTDVNVLNEGVRVRAPFFGTGS